MRGSKQIRVLGGLLVAIGLFLLGLMGTISWNLADGLLHPGMGDGARFTGTAEQGRMILNLFALVLAVGVMALVTGAWQLATGRRSRAMAFAALALAALLIAVVWSTNRMLG